MRTNRDGDKYQVSGKWTPGSVRGIIENPIYSGQMAFGRRGYGSLRRFDPKSHTGYRHVENHERIPGTNRARAKEERDPANWLMVTPAVKYDPVVPLGVWEANISRLAAQGARGGQRGKPKCADPDRFPLCVVCSDCGQRMNGHYHDGNHLIYKCSTFLNSNGELCHPNWVSRAQVVTFALELVRRRIYALSDRQRFEKEVQSALDAARVNRSDLEQRLHAARAKEGALKRKFDRVLCLVMEAESEEEAKAADVALKAQRAEVAAAGMAVSSLEAEVAAIGVPMGDDVATAVEYLQGLDRMLRQMPPGRLRDVFDGMGIRLTIRFESNTGKGRRRRLPVGGVMQLGATPIDSALLDTKAPSAGAEGASSSEEHGDGCGGRI